MDQNSNTLERKVYGMIKNPYALLEIRHLDWDDMVIGVLYIPRALKDARLLVDIFVEANMIHPDLQASRFSGYKDPWADERREKHARSKRDWPRRRIYPVETIIPEMTEDGKIRVREDGTIHFLRHDLEYRPAEYVKQTGPSRGKSFRPEKGD